MRIQIKNLTSPLYVRILWLLIFLFLSRVIGQLIQYFNPIKWLPQFEAWQGSGLPYEFLFFSQLIILVVMVRSARLHALGRVRKNINQGKWLLGFGAIYFVVMVGRLVIGITHLSNHFWFGKPIPIFFHLVLATFVILVAAYHMGWLDKEDDNDLGG